MDFLSDEQKIYELSRIWKDAEYNFAFWDKVTIDWDEEYRKALPLVLATQDTYEYYRELTRFLALLGDGHTGVTPPMEMMQSAEYYSMFPVYLAWFEKDIVIVCVSEELKEEIPLFSVVKAIDGVEISQYIQKECYPYIWHTNEDACGNDVIKELLYGRAESKAVFTLEKYDNRFDVKLKRQDALGIKWSASGFFGSKYIERQVILDDESCKLDQSSLTQTLCSIILIFLMRRESGIGLKET
nr:hypothetical protein [uncultured Butyrivibrio sp.]